MKRKIIFICIAVLFACEKEKQETPTTKQVAVVSKDLGGKLDPLADTNAVVGGTYNTWGSGFPKSLNYWLDPNSFNGDLMGLLFESLTGLHSVENKAVGILAKSWEISDSGKVFTFHLQAEARWSDGKKITARDVQFYYDVVMNPKNKTSVFRVDLKRFERPEILDKHTIRVRASKVHWKNFQSAGSFMAFPTHLWEGKDFNAQNFDFPVVSGPYALKKVKKNRFVLLERRADWWGRGLSYNRGKYNFAQIKYRFTEDRVKALELFKKGDYDLYPIYTARIWARQTDFAQVKKNWVVRQRIYNREPVGFQGMAFNLRLKRFQDLRVRKALAHLLNRERMNEKLMFNEYFLLNTYWPDLNKDLKNPEAPFFEYNPEKARKLFFEAGWLVDDKGLLKKDGKQFSVNFITASPDQRHLNIYLEDLKAVGIRAGIEQLSWSSITKRMDKKDFEMYWMAFGAGRFKDPEQLWMSKYADEDGSYNYTGFSDPLVDSLIEVQMGIFDMEKRNDILRRMDTRIASQVPTVLLWNLDNHRLLYWNRFSYPKNPLGKFQREEAVIVYWWVDAKKEEALKKARKEGSVLASQAAKVFYKDVRN